MAAHKKGKTGKTATGDPQMEQPGGPIVLAAGSRRCLFGWIGLLQDPVLENGHSHVHWQGPQVPLLDRTLVPDA